MRVTRLRRAPRWLSVTPAIVVSATLVVLGDGVTAGAILAIAVVTAMVGRLLGDRVRGSLAALNLTTTIGTPLVRRTTWLVRIVTLVILVITMAMFLVGMLHERPTSVTLAACAALATATINHELPTVATGILAARAARMARRNVAVRNLSAVETVARTTVICTDKAGPLTENEVTVTAVVADGRTYETTGVGYSPAGEIRTAGTAVSLGENIALDECLTAGLACNDSRVVEDDGWRVVGDPAEGAMLTCAAKLGVDKEPTRVDTLPFATDRRFMATLHRLRRDEPGTVYVKGSVERVLYMCRTQLDASGRLRELDGAGTRAAASSFGRRGLRVVALAYAQVAPEVGTLTEDTIPPMIFLGMQIMYDPVRPWAAEVVRACQGAGIVVKMITEDDTTAARAMASWIGLDGDALMTGAELRACSADELPDAVTRAAVLVRISPEEKRLLVRTLHSRRHVVAMTGRTAADLPSLRDADVGIDARPTDTGRDTHLKDTLPIWRATDLHLRDGDFASILAAVEEGRRALGQLTRYLEWALPAVLGPGLLLAAATLADTAQPIEPVQVLWLSFIAALVLRLPLGIALTGESAAYDAEPRTTLSWPYVRLGVQLGVLVGGAVGLFAWAQAYGATPAEARTAVVNAFAVAALAPLLGRRRGQPLALLPPAALIALQLAFTYAPAMHGLLGSAPLDGAAWLSVLVVAGAGLLLTAPTSRRRPAPRPTLRA